MFCAIKVRSLKILPQFQISQIWFCWSDFPLVAAVDAFHAIDYLVVGQRGANTWKFFIQITLNITSVTFVRK